MKYKTLAIFGLIFLALTVSSVSADLYNISNITSCNQLLCVLQESNNLSEGWYGIMFMLSFTIIIFAASSQVFRAPVAASSAIFANLLMGSIMWAIQLVPDIYMIISVVAAAIMAWILGHER